MISNERISKDTLLVKGLKNEVRTTTALIFSFQINEYLRLREKQNETKNCNYPYSFFDASGSFAGGK